MLLFSFFFFPLSLTIRYQWIPDPQCKMKRLGDSISKVSHQSLLIVLSLIRKHFCTSGTLIQSYQPSGFVIYQGGNGRFISYATE